MVINKLDDAAQKNRICFAATCGGVNQPTAAINNVLPSLQLKLEGLKAFCRKPLVYYFIAYGVL